MAQPRIELLILDVNGVLYHYDVDKRIDALARLLERTPDEVAAAIFDSGIEDAADAGELGPDDYLAQAGAELDVVFDRDTWGRALAAAVEPNNEVLALVAGLRDQVPMITLSNNGLLVKEEVDRVYPRVVDLGITFHVAAELGAAKPDRDVYRDVCDLHGVSPRAAAFIDDKQKNVDGAERAGLTAHRFGDLAGLEVFLAGCGFEP